VDADGIGHRRAETIDHQRWSVIASAAKQSMAQQVARWIASLRSQ
jgi:hypothetical protein